MTHTRFVTLEIATGFTSKLEESTISWVIFIDRSQVIHSMRLIVQKLMSCAQVFPEGLRLLGVHDLPLSLLMVAQGHVWETSIKTRQIRHGCNMGLHLCPQL